MNLIRSTISSIAIIDGKPADQYLLVYKFMKAVFHLKPALPRCNITWNHQVVFDYIKGLGPNKRLSHIQITRKLAILMMLEHGQRGQTLQFLDVRKMFFTPSIVVFTLGDS